MTYIILKKINYISILIIFIETILTMYSKCNDKNENRELKKNGDLIEIEDSLYTL